MINQLDLAPITQILPLKVTQMPCDLHAKHQLTVVRVQNGSAAHPASYPMGTRSSFPGGKAAGA
jgi:hypothetical protein